jgi:general secretion pathway protein L
MEHWLARVAELQLAPQVVFAESDLAPLLPGHVTMLIADDQLLLRNDTGRPLVLPASDPVLAFDMLLGSGADATTVNLAVYASPSDWEKYSVAVEPLRERCASFKVHLGAGGVLAMLAQGLAHATPINLLQGSFKPRTGMERNWKQWRWAAVLAAALLLLHGVGSWWQLHQLRKANQLLDGEITQLYSSVFPGQRPGREPRRTMEQRLASLAGDANQKGELLHLLAAVAAAKQNVPVAQLGSFTFKPGSMQMKLIAPDATTLEQFSQALRGSGYAAEVTAGTVRGSTYEGQVELRNSGS